MRIAFRVDSSVEIGSGHVMRSLALAQELRHAGSDVTFLMRRHKGNMIEYVQRQSFSVKSLESPATSLAPGRRQPYEEWLGVSWKTDVRDVTEMLESQPVDWMIVDHYGLDQNWETGIRPIALRVLVVDDLADRPHDCDVLIDSNAQPEGASRYATLVSPGTKVLLGPSYAFLREEFRNLSAKRRIRKSVNRILIFLGGSDPLDLTSIALQACRDLKLSCRIDVVVGSGNPKAEQIKATCAEQANSFYHQQTTRLAELITEADLAIGGGGQSAWERVYLGLPAITIPWADNQVSGSRALSQEGVLELLPMPANADHLIHVIDRFISDRQRLETMSAKALELATRFGPASGTQNVVSVMKETTASVAH